MTTFKTIIKNLAVEIATELMDSPDAEVRKFAKVFMRTFLKTKIGG